LEPEPDGEKKPSAKTPPLEMSRSPGESGLALVNWSSDLQTQIIRRSRRMKMVRQAVPIISSLLMDMVESQGRRKWHQDIDQVVARGHGGVIPGVNQ
jgi:hypothetical protein